MNKIILIIFYFILNSSLILTQIFESFGNYIIKYYEKSDKDCLKEPVDKIIIDIENSTEKCIETPNASIYLANWKPFSNSLGYKIVDNCSESTVNELEEEEIEEEDGSLLCNGFCSRDRFSNYNYICYYNNIRDSADIILNFYNDKKCKNKIKEEITMKNKCESFDNYSILPLNWKDEKKYLYYKNYTNHTNCYGEIINNITESYFFCNKKCHKMSNSNVSEIFYYKCEFTKENFLFFNKILFFLILIIL